MIDKQGLKHYVYHSKPDQLPKGYRMTISLRKIAPTGYTVGISICSPQDQFEKKIGFLKATGRAMAKKEEVFTIENRNEYVSDVFKDIAGQIKKGKVSPLPHFL